MKPKYKAPFGKQLLVAPLLAMSLVLVGCSSSDDDTPDPAEMEVDAGADADASDADADAGDVDAGDVDAGDTDAGDTDTTESSADSGQVVLTTIASDFSSSALDIFSLTEPREGVTAVNPGVSDTIVRTFEDMYYVIRRFESDSITAYSASDTSTPIFQTSTNDGGCLLYTSPSPRD